MGSEAEQTPAPAADAGETRSLPPTFSTKTTTGIVTVDWHDQRPDVVLITSDSIDAIVEERNRLTRRAAGLENLVTILRLGRRPNAQDYRDAGMRP